MKSIYKYFLLVILFLGGTIHASAQAESDYSFFGEYLLEIVLGLALVVSVIVLVVLIVILNVLQAFVRKQFEIEKEMAVAAGKEVPVYEESSLFSGFYKKLTDAVPIEREGEVLTDHEYDGIRELDNNLPPWWTALFYITIFFGVVYLGYYHLFGGPSSLDEYNSEVAVAEAKLAALAESSGEADIVVDENNVAVVDDAAQLANGQGLFVQYCAACHANDGGGGIGPNFTDEYWIHGGGLNNIYRTIKVGVPQKGMISWEGQLSPAQIQLLSNVIWNMQGTTPAAPKEPQGDIWTEEVTEVTEEAADGE